MDMVWWRLKGEVLCRNKRRQVFWQTDCGSIVAIVALQRFHTVIFLDKCEKSMEGESGVLV